MFDTADEVADARRGQDYVIDSDLAVVVLLATRLLLHVQMLRDHIGELLAEAPDMTSAAKRLRAQDTGLYSEHFLSVRPLLETVLSEDPVVLLVDEVDRTEESMEALLLEVLAERQITVPEVGTFTARSTPWVVLTSNDTRELSPALKRRCLHFHVEFPDAARETEIVSRRAPEVADDLIGDVVELARRLREMPLRKAPSISEVVDAARAAAVLGDAGDAHRGPLMATLLKYSSDLDLATRRLTGEGEPAPAVPVAKDEWVTPSRPRNTTTAAFRGRGGNNGNRYDQPRRGRR